MALPPEKCSAYIFEIWVCVAFHQSSIQNITNVQQTLASLGQFLRNWVRTVFFPPDGGKKPIDYYYSISYNEK